MLTIFGTIANAFARFFRAIIPGSRCPIHKEALKTGMSSVCHGLKRGSQGYNDASKKLFPCARSVMAGCFVGRPKPKKTKFCSKCREVEQEWLRDNQINWEELMRLDLIRAIVDKARQIEEQK